MNSNRVVPPEIDMLIAFCLKERYYDDAKFLYQFKEAMQKDMKLGPEAQKKFAEIVLLYKTALILGRA